MSEARIDRLEEDIHDIKASLARLEPMIIRIDAILPHLATKAELTIGLAELKVELADKPGRTYLWIVFSALIVAYAAGIGALAVVLQLHSSAQPVPMPHASLAPAGMVLAGEAFDWDSYHDRQDACRELSQVQLACTTGGRAACDQGLIDRLQRQCSAFGSLGQRFH
jgi:hypothetical protein